MSKVTGVEKNAELQFKFCWVIALRAEASPLIDVFNMKIVENNNFIFSTKKKKIKMSNLLDDVSSQLRRGDDDDDEK